MKDILSRSALGNDENGLEASSLSYNPFQSHHGDSSVVVTVGSGRKALDCVIIQNIVRGQEPTHKWMRRLLRGPIHTWMRWSNPQILDEEVNQPFMFLGIRSARCFLALRKLPKKTSKSIAKATQRILYSTG
jgi:hypothetical protein